MGDSNFYGQYAATLLRNGYEPLPVTPGTKAVRVADWQKVNIDIPLIDKWLSQGKGDHGIGFRTRFTPAVDIDVRDDAVASAIEELFTRELGDAPVRVGQAPKRLLLFRTDSPFRKLKREFADKNGEIHAVEILCDGQQFVGYGIHPTTGKPFEWGMDDPVFVAADALPTLSGEDAARLLEKTGEVVARFGWHDMGGDNGKRKAATVDSDDDFLNFTQGVDLTDSEIDAYLADLPNDVDTHYDTWATVGMALWHQYQGSPEGFEKWVEWSSNSPKHSPGDMDYKWESFNDDGKGSAITFKTIIKWVNDERKKNATVMHADLVARLTSAQDRSVLDSVKRDIAVLQLDPESRDDLITRLKAAYARLGLTVSKAVLLKGVAAEKKANSQKIHIADLENALAQQVLDDHFAGGAHLLRFAGQCWQYIDGVWRAIDSEQVEGCVKDTLTQMKLSNGDNYRQLLEAAREAGRDDRLSALIQSVAKITFLEVRSRNEPDPLNLRGDSAGYVINCQNGELWFNDKGAISFRKHDPAHRLTTQIAASYDPSATCPEFSAALDVIFQRCKEPEDVIRHWLEMMGILIQPTRQQAFWLLMKGPGGNGKSFLMEVIASLMGADSCYAGSVADLPGRGGGSNNHFTASLIGKLMFLDDDLQSGILLPDGWIKKLSEEKLMTANPKGAKTFEFISRATLVALSNNWPSTSDITHGMRRRAHVIELNYTIPPSQVDSGLKRRVLRNELSGVLNLLVAGFQRFLRRRCKLQLPVECAASQDTWLHNGNPTVRFIHEVLDTAADAHNVPAYNVYEEYRNWALESGERVTVLGRNAFYQAMEAEGFTLKYYKGRRWFKGVRFKDWREGGVEHAFDDLDDDCGL